MPTKLPSPIDSYFAATNRHDIDGMIAAFAETAIVHDERADMRGRTAIRQWLEESKLKYSHTVEVTNAVAEDGTVTVTGIVSGNFTGSPVTLDYTFTLADGKIARLEIG